MGHRKRGSPLRQVSVHCPTSPKRDVSFSLQVKLYVFGWEELREPLGSSDMFAVEFYGNTRDWCLIYVYKKAMVRVGRGSCIGNKQWSLIKKACVEALGLGAGVSVSLCIKGVASRSFQWGVSEKPSKVPMYYKLTLGIYHI